MSNTGIILAAADLSWAWIAFDAALILFLLVLSSIYSGSEAVLFSLTPLQLERAAVHPSPFWRLAARLMARPKQTLLTILLTNTAANTLLFATSYVTFHHMAKHVGAWVTPVSGVLSILLVLVCGEVLPKVVGVRLADRLAPYVAPLVRAASLVAAPLGRVFDVLLVEPFLRIVFGAERAGHAASADLTAAELKALLELSRRAGGLKPLEDTFLRPIIDLGQWRVRDVMVPRVEVAAYDVNAPAEGLRDLMRQTRHKKIPVYDKSRDKIVGLVYAKVLFFDPHKPLRELVQPVRFVPELITCEQLLVHFRQTKTQLAIAVDEYGGVAGLVTLEDVLEEIVGEIRDEYDATEQPEIVELAPGSYLVDGRTTLDALSEALGTAFSHEEVSTAGGLAYSALGRVPIAGERLDLNGWRVTVDQVVRRSIRRLRFERVAP